MEQPLSHKMCLHNVSPPPVAWYLLLYRKLGIFSLDPRSEVLTAQEHLFSPSQLTLSSSGCQSEWQPRR